mmetsp:Transcript_52061/g.111440  ORF Transcript_52061/g.111440 Transcript_52061/m.111440 type:complete len:143 (-) Transcript_52061:181-609(-)
MSGGKFAKATEDAKKYTEEHDLERLVTQMANMVVTVKPENPQAYMARWLMDRCTKEQLKNVNLKITRDLPEPKMRGERSRAAYERHLEQVANSKKASGLTAEDLAAELAAAEASKLPSKDAPPGEAAVGEAEAVEAAGEGEV